VALSIKYKSDESYTVPISHLVFLLDNLEWNTQVFSLSTDVTSVEHINYNFYSSSRIEKKIIWDLIKGLHILFTELSKGVSIKEISPQLKSAVVQGLHSTDNNFPGDSQKEIYTNLVQIINDAREFHWKIADIVDSSNRGYKIVIPCELA